MSKSKRIKDAAKELERALKKHVEVVSDSAVSMKKAQRAAARLASAAQVYAESVTAKTGLDNPFLTGGGHLDAKATQSLLAERDEIAKSLTGSIPAIEELPTEVDLSITETSAFTEVGPLEDAAEDWADGSIELDEDDMPAASDDASVNEGPRESSTEPAEGGEGDLDPAPALPDEAPSSEEDKPYSEDI